MNVKLKVILEAAPVLQKVSSFSLPAKVSYNIMRNTRKIEHELKPFEETRLKLVDKFGTVGDDGRTKVTPENMELFYKEVATMLEEDVDIDIRLIKINDLQDVKLSPNEIQYIEFMLEKEE